ncbi:MAG: hypothetical protein HQL86_04675 [Magnetococcales bacterium]|nr:hypothetical protein [Magnetococcales bacterium]
MGIFFCDFAFRALFTISDFSRCIAKKSRMRAWAYSPELLELPLKLLEGGNQSHAHVVARVLRSAHQRYVIDEIDFVRKILDQAKQIGQQAVDDVTDALLGSVLFRVRSRNLGEPCEQDVALQMHAQEILPRLNRMKPAHRLPEGTVTWETVTGHKQTVHSPAVDG